MFWNNYPYSNLHDLNLDWIIRQLFEVKQGLQFVIDNASLKYADPIQWNITRQYQANTVVIDPAYGIAYLSTQPVPNNIMITDTDYWTPIFDLSQLFETIKESICFNLEYYPVSANDYPAGSYIFVDNILFKVISDITEGTAFAENVNVERVCVTDLITGVETNIVNLENRVDSIESGIVEDIGEKLNSVYIYDIRKEHPDYTDDQLMQEAITECANAGNHPLIVWDHHDADFSGDITFDISASSGIDFNGQTVNMPMKDGTLFIIEPEDTQELSIVSTSFDEYQTSEGQLFNKVFTMNESTSGVSAMCAGERYNFSGTYIYACQCFVTDPKGQYINSKANYLPSTAVNIPIHNVHSIPEFTTVIKNAHIHYPAANVMMLFLNCTRSKCLISDITVTGYVNVTTYHTGVISFTACAYIEVERLNGCNPIQTSLTSGYLLSFFDGISDVFVHDCQMYDTTTPSWGALGTNCITNFTFERCTAQRFDCHYFSWGQITIRDCNLDYINWSAGVANWVIDHCNFTRRLPNYSNIMSLRSDSPARLAGSISISNCRVRVDTGDGATEETTRFVSNCMVHRPLTNMNIASLPSSVCCLFIHDCKIEHCFAIVEGSDVDNGNGSSDYAAMEIQIENVYAPIENVGTHNHVVYRQNAAHVRAIARVLINNSFIKVNQFGRAAMSSLIISGCQIEPSLPISCLYNTSLACIITGSRFGGFDTSGGLMFQYLNCSGNYIDRYQPTWTSGLATNYMLTGNISRETATQQDWYNGNSYSL